MAVEKMTSKMYVIKSEYTPSRIQNGHDWFYRVYYVGKNGNLSISRGRFPTKTEARKFISQECKACNELIKKSIGTGIEYRLK